MFILNEEIKEQERQAIKELYPKFSDTTVIGNYYYFQTDNLLIGYGILKTIEGVFDSNLRVVLYFLMK